MTLCRALPDGGHPSIPFAGATIANTLETLWPTVVIYFFSGFLCCPLRLVITYFAVLQFTILRLHMVELCPAPYARLGRLLTHALAGALCTPWPAPDARLGRLLTHALAGSLGTPWPAPEAFHGRCLYILPWPATGYLDRRRFAIRS